MNKKYLRGTDDTCEVEQGVGHKHAVARLVKCLFTVWKKDGSPDDWGYIHGMSADDFWEMAGVITDIEQDESIHDTRDI